MRTLEGEVAGPCDKGEPSEICDLGRNGLCKTRAALIPVQNRRAAERKLINALERIFYPLEVIAQHGRINPTILAKRETPSRPAYASCRFSRCPSLGRLRRDGIAQCRYRRNQAAHGLDGGTRCSWRKESLSLEDCDMCTCSFG